MKLEIKCGKEDLKGVAKAMKPFCEDFETSYKEEVQKAIHSKKAQMMGLSKRIELAMPDEISMFAYVEKDKVIMVNSLPDSRIAKMTGQYKKMVKSVEDYLGHVGFKDFSVKIVKHKV